MSRIVSTGSYCPETIVANNFFNKPLDPKELGTIEKYMTGMKERRHASANETGIYMATMAGKNSLQKSDYLAKDVDLIIGNITPNEYLMPEDLNLVSKNLGCTNASVIPINTACSSFLTALNIADSIIASKKKRLVLIVNSTNWVNTIISHDKDYSMFGDGAGAVLLDDSGNSLLDIEESSDTSVFHTMRMKSPVFSGIHENFEIREDPKIDMLEEQIRKPIDVAKAIVIGTKHNIDRFIAHQAGIGMLEYWAGQAGVDKSILRHTFDKFANMMSANIPVSLDYWINKGDIARGNVILFFSPATGAHYISMLWKF